MEEAATTNAANNIDDGDRDAVSVAAHNAAKVQIPIPPRCLPVIMPYVGAPLATIASTVPVEKIVAISHNGQDGSTVQPRNDYRLPPKKH